MNCVIVYIAYVKYFTNSFIFVLFQVHVNIMMLEARIQAGLLYGLRALMRYMT